MFPEGLENILLEFPLLALQTSWHASECGFLQHTQPHGGAHRELKGCSQAGSALRPEEG